jgi:hypothetical protein
VHGVVENEKWQAEDGEGVRGVQLVILDVDVELLCEAVDGQCGEVSGGGVDLGQVVAGMVEVASAGQY